MDLRKIERKRTELLFIALLLIVVFSTTVIVLAVLEGRGHLIPGLGILSILFCLYVIQRERRLKRDRVDLVEAIIQKERDLRSAQGKVESLGGKLQEIAALYRAISTVNANRVPEKTYEAIIHAALDLADAKNGSVMLINKKRGVLEIAAAVGLSEEVIRSAAQPLGEGVAGWVAAQGEPLLLAGKVQDERFRRFVVRDDKIPSSMCVPLQAAGETIGVLNVSVGAEEIGRHFTEQDLRLISIFSNHATVAIENARLKAAVRVLA